MSVGLDTSVVLRLLTGTPTAQAEQAARVVANAAVPVMISDLVVSEVYFALRHHYEVLHRDSVRAITALLDDARIDSPGVARAVLAADSASGAVGKAGLMDRLILGDYEREGAGLVTFDRDLARLRGATLLRG